MVIVFNAPTEEIVREVLGLTYSTWGFQSETTLIERIVTLLDDPAMKVQDEGESDASIAASEIRELLWNRYTGGGISAAATCQLFMALGRMKELGWIREEANGFNTFHQEMFLDSIVSIRQEKGQ